MFTTTRRTLLLSLLASPTVQAQPGPYPQRPIKWIVPYLPGTSPDQTVRILAEAIAPTLKQSIVVENRPGAGGNLGAQAAARSPADGYTWVYSGSPMATSMKLYKKPGYDAMKDFIHIGRIGLSELTVVSSTEGGATSLKELLDTGRKQPGKLSFGSGGIGSPAHMAGEWLMSSAGIQAVHVPYKGATESLNAAMGRQVDFTVAITSVVLPHIQSGRLQALGVTSPHRHPRLPQVPTLQEAGLPVTLVSVGGLSVPARTPSEVVRRIAEALDKALAQPEVKSRMEALGGQIVASTPEEYTELLRQEIGLAEKMMKAANIEAQ